MSERSERIMGSVSARSGRPAKRGERRPGVPLGEKHRSQGLFGEGLEERRVHPPGDGGELVGALPCGGKVARRQRDLDERGQDAAQPRIAVKHRPRGGHEGRGSSSPNEEPA